MKLALLWPTLPWGKPRSVWWKPISNFDSTDGTSLSFPNGQGASFCTEARKANAWIRGEPWHNSDIKPSLLLFEWIFCFLGDCEWCSFLQQRGCLHHNKHFGGTAGRQVWVFGRAQSLWLWWGDLSSTHYPSGASLFSFLGTELGWPFLHRDAVRLKKK